MSTIPISISLTLDGAEARLAIRADKPPLGIVNTNRPRWKEVLVQNRILWLEVFEPMNTLRFRVEGPTPIASICFSTFTLGVRNNEPFNRFSEQTWVLGSATEHDLNVSHLSFTTLDIEIADSSTVTRKYKGNVTQNPPIFGDNMLSQG